jgi:hypothetical protein
MIATGAEQTSMLYILSALVSRPEPRPCRRIGGEVGGPRCSMSLSNSLHIGVTK